jgi:hypothetical protein
MNIHNYSSMDINLKYMVGLYLAFLQLPYQVKCWLRLLIVII